MDCIFCKIVKKEIKSNIVYEDNKLIAFEDTNPQAPVHILIIPKKHIESLNEIDEEDLEVLGEIQMLAKKISKEKNLKDGFRLVLNTGPLAGQSVNHLHYHLLGGRRFSWPPG